MGGFERDKARQVLQLPDQFELHAVVAIGYQGDIHDLPDELQQREQPSQRRSLKESLYEGKYGSEALK